MTPLAAPLVRELVRAIRGNERGCHLLARLLEELEPQLTALVPPPPEPAPVSTEKAPPRYVQEALFAEPKVQPRRRR